MVRFGTVLALSFLVAACAAQPESIPASSVSPHLYEGLTCAELETELRFAYERRDALYKRQKGNRTRDGLLNVLVLPGLGAIAPDHEQEIAEIKGRIEQLYRRKARC